MNDQEKSTPFEFKCDECGKELASKLNLTNHTKKIHQKIAEPLPILQASPLNLPSTVSFCVDDDLNTENEIMEAFAQEQMLLEEIESKAQGYKEAVRDDDEGEELLAKIKRFKVVVEMKNKHMKAVKDAKDKMEEEMKKTRQVESAQFQELVIKEKEIEILKTELKTGKMQVLSIIKDAKDKKKVIKDLKNEKLQLNEDLQILRETIVSLETNLATKDNIANECEIELIDVGPTSSKASMSKATSGHLCVTCDRTFNTNRDLERHMDAKHTQHFEKECPFCSQSYTNMQNLVNHIDKCMDSSRIIKQCPSCTKSFAEEAMKMHMEKGKCKPKAKTIVCSVCGLICTSENNLKRHISDEHRDDGERLREVCQHYRRGHCFKGDGCKFAHVGFQNNSTDKKERITTVRSCRNGEDCNWLARGKCHFSHKKQFQLVPHEEAGYRSQKELLCWFNERCTRTPCSFKHNSVADFPNLGNVQRPQVWNQNNGKFSH